MTLISSQHYRDQEIVDSKIAAKDFDVYYQVFSNDFALVVDGHHSHEAAIQEGVEPNYIDATNMDGFDNIQETYRVLGSLDAFLEAHFMDGEWYDIKTGKLVF